MPSVTNDIRLGDMVVSAPSGTSGRVIEHDMGKQTPTGFIQMGFLCPPPTEWTSVMVKMQSDHRMAPNKIKKFISEMPDNSLREYYQRPPPAADVLFQSDYHHDPDQSSCSRCDKSKIIHRRQRRLPDESRVLYGLIASGNRVMKDAMERDKISRDSEEKGGGGIVL